MEKEKKQEEEEEWVSVLNVRKCGEVEEEEEVVVVSPVCPSASCRDSG